MQTSDVSAEPGSSSPSVELLTESLSLLRNEEADAVVFRLDLSKFVVEEGKKVEYILEICSPVSFIVNDLRQWICTKLNFYLPPYKNAQMETDELFENVIPYKDYAIHHLHLPSLSFSSSLSS